MFSTGPRAAHWQSRADSITPCSQPRNGTSRRSPSSAVSIGAEADSPSLTLIRGPLMLVYSRVGTGRGAVVPREPGMRRAEARPHALRHAPGAVASLDLLIGSSSQRARRGRSEPEPTPGPAGRTDGRVPRSATSSDARGSASAAASRAPRARQGCSRSSSAPRPLARSRSLDGSVRRAVDQQRKDRDARWRARGSRPPSAAARQHRCGARADKGRRWVALDPPRRLHVRPLLALVSPEPLRDHSLERRAIGTLAGALQASSSCGAAGPCARTASLATLAKPSPTKIASRRIGRSSCTCDPGLATFTWPSAVGPTRAGSAAA